MRFFELEIGEAIEVGGRIVTVVDIDGENVSVRIDPHDGVPIGFDENLLGDDPEV